MKSPFKFLDPFTLADRDVFFGRETEIKMLYRLVFKTPLLLIYGLSGTGKTSLIQCGLAGKFEGPDWLPLWIRRQNDLNESLQATLKRALPSTSSTIPAQIKELYRYYLRPVYLIFDQFEELFILGNTKEREIFEKTLTAILKEELPCTILLVMREEYLGRLYPIEKAIPNLFDFRMRVEPMDTANVKKVIRNSFQKFNISIGEPPQEERLDDIIQNVSLGRSGIELPYLQVYLDLLYREDAARTPHTSPNAQGWPALEFTKQEINDFGTIENVLEKFLKKQQERIQAILFKQDGSIADTTVKLVLDGFVTEEGTKRPISYKRENDKIVIDALQLHYFPKVSSEQLSKCLVELEKAKILRSEDDSIELAHDSLAQIIDKYRTDEERQRNDIKRQIRSSKATFSRTGEYLTQKQIAMFEDELPLLGLSEEEDSFFNKSKEFREQESRKELEDEKSRNEQLQDALDRAEAAKQIAEQERKKAEEEKTNSEKQTDLANVAKNEAEKQKELAEIERENAQIQATLANQAKLEAEKQKELAEIEKNNAEKQTLKANAAKSEADKQKEYAKKNAKWAFGIAAIAVILGLGAIWFYCDAKSQKETADKAQKKAEENLRQFQQTEINTYLLDTETFQKSGNRAEAGIALDSARSITERYFKKDIKYDSLMKEIKKREQKQTIKP